MKLWKRPRACRRAPRELSTAPRQPQPDRRWSAKQPMARANGWHARWLSDRNNEFFSGGVAFGVGLTRARRRCETGLARSTLYGHDPSPIFERSPFLMTRTP